MTIRRLGFVVLSLIILLMLAACKSGGDRYELTNYMGKSKQIFEKRSGTKLAEQSNGVYLMEGVVQILVPEKKVTSITILEKAGDYKLFGVTIGMTQETVNELLSEDFGKEISITTDSKKNTMTYAYLKKDKQLYISFDLDSKLVVGASYYTISDADQTGEEPENAGEMVLMVGNIKVYYNEAMVYLKMAQDKYETDYGKEIWNVDILGNGETFGRLMKREVINQITELKIICNEAKRDGTVLSEEELADANIYAKEHYDSLSEEDKKAGLITEQLLAQTYSDNLLANKLFEKLTIEVDTNVSDEEAKQITVQDIFIQNYNLDADGKQVKLPEQDKQTAYKKVQSLLEKAKETQDFKSLAEANSEAKDTEFTFGKGSAPQEFGEAFQTAAFSLTTGELSDIITTDNGWHIIYCVSDYNKDATIEVKEDIIEERRNDMFSKLYTEWSKDYEVVVNQQAWDAISLDQ